MIHNIATVTGLLSRYTYELRFYSRDGRDEVFEHLRERDARAHLGLFGKEDADTYTRIELREVDWEADGPAPSVKLLDTLTFPT